jgi:hypothetical protein
MRERSNNSLYALAVANVRKHEPRAFDTHSPHGREQSFPQTLKRALISQHSIGVTELEVDSHKELMEWCWNDRWRPSFVPDLWFIDEKERSVRLIEIEDTSPITPRKLNELIDFFWAMDNENWAVEVVVFDRYGLNPRELSLQRADFAGRGIDTNSPNYRSMTDFLGLPPDA